jgi:hypothetical protein
MSNGRSSSGADETKMSDSGRHASSRFKARRLAKRGSRLSLAVFALVILVAGCAESVKHDETLAARRALEFGRVIFLEKNLDQGYALLADGGRRHVPRDKFKQSIAAMHTRDYPTTLAAVEFEPMADEKAIYIFVRGQNREEQFNYRFTMEGTPATDYKVLKIDQGSGFFTLSNKKQAFKPPLTMDNS